MTDQGFHLVWRSEVNQQGISKPGDAKRMTNLPYKEQNPLPFKHIDLPGDPVPTSLAALLKVFFNTKKTMATQYEDLEKVKRLVLLVSPSEQTLQPNGNLSAPHNPASEVSCRTPQAYVEAINELIDRRPPAISVVIAVREKEVAAPSPFVAVKEDEEYLQMVSWGFGRHTEVTPAIVEAQAAFANERRTGWLPDDAIRASWRELYQATQEAHEQPAATNAVAVPGQRLPRMQPLRELPDASSYPVGAAEGQNMALGITMEEYALRPYIGRAEAARRQ